MLVRWRRELQLPMGGGSTVHPTATSFPARPTDSAIGISIQKSTYENRLLTLCVTCIFDYVRKCTKTMSFSIWMALLKDYEGTPQQSSLRDETFVLRRKPSSLLQWPNGRTIESATSLPTLSHRGGWRGGHSQKVSVGSQSNIGPQMVIRTNGFVTL